MLKIGIVGLKEDREAVLTTLHDLGVAQVETVSAETLRYLDPERGDELQRIVGDEALRFRGLKSALPPSPVGAPQTFQDLDATLAAAKSVPTAEVDDVVGSLEREDDQLQTENRSIGDTLEVLGKLAFYRQSLSYLDPKSSLVFLGETDPETYETLRAAVPPEAEAMFFAGGVPGRFLLLAPRDQADVVSRVAATSGVRLTPIPRLRGTVEEERGRLETRRAEIDQRRTEIHARLQVVSATWYPIVTGLEEALAIQNRLFEVYTKLGAGRVTFAIEGWVPQRDLRRLQAAVDLASHRRAHFYTVPTDEEAPTLMDNPPGIRRYEFFIRFYSLPQANEWDPTLVFAIVFPIFFGFMLGDFGYGLVILAVSIWMIRGFPGAQHLPKKGRNFVKMIMGPRGMQQLAYALLPGCAIAIGLGLVLDEFFGFTPLHTYFGYVAPIQPGVNVGLLLLVAGFIGLGMVTLGFLFGALKEYFHRHLRAAVGKVGGILFAWGIAFLGLSVIYKTDTFSHPAFVLDLALVIGGLVLMVGGEGIQTGVMGLIEVVSHILSYTRLVGILLASVILADVINIISFRLVHHGSFLIVVGLLILVIGQSFNLIIGVFEPGIQGARLIFVEYFSKFYTGNGKPFRPFGAKRTHTTAAPPDATAASAVGTSPGAGPFIRSSDGPATLT
ncbi:MAG: V-type ATP synthase subunit I [Thermoplasmata archaeon]|jgi:V/A-type H+-transporting ATPase subunit I